MMLENLPEFDDFDEELALQEPELSEKPWKKGKKKRSKHTNRRFDGDEWEELQKAKAKYLKDWEEDMRYAQELAEESM